MSYKLDGTRIKTPTGFAPEYFIISKAQRLSSGKMTMDMIARKKKFALTYASIDAVELKIIRDILFSLKPFHTFKYPDIDGSEVEATVYVGAIKGIEHRKTVYKNVTFNLIEQ